MLREQVSIPTADGPCDAWVHTPEGAGPWPAVIMFTDAGGVRDTFHAMADRLAELGYVVLLPDPYHRDAPVAPFDMTAVWGDKDEIGRLFGLVATKTEERARVDTGAFLDHLAGRPDVADGKVGVTGYCMGGRQCLWAGAMFPDRVGAVASFHGGNLATTEPDSPHRRAGAITAEVYVAAAADDRTFDDEQHARLADALRGAGVTHTITTYQAAHGFAVPDVPVYDADADAQHWAALEDLFGRKLP